MINVKYAMQIECEKCDDFESAYLPNYAIVSLSQDFGGKSVPYVEVGDIVKEGQLIAYGGDDCCNIHSPIPGKIVSFSDMPTPDGKKTLSIIIKLQGSFSFLGKTNKLHDSDSLSQTQLIRFITEKGIVNTFDKPVSFGLELASYKDTEDVILAVRLFDSDPSVYLESFLSKKFLQDVIDGTAMICSTINVSNVVFFYDPKHLQLSMNNIETYQSYFTNSKVDFIPVKTNKYPYGKRLDLKKAIKKHFSKSNKKIKDSNLLMVDSLTVYTVNETITRSEPVISTFVYIGGDCLQKSGVYKVKIGTPIKDLLNECGSFVDDPSLIIINGILGGNAIYDMNTPITKYVKSINIIPSKTFESKKISSCIVCGRCVNICPTALRPFALYKYFNTNEPQLEYLKKTSLACSECGLCNMCCPARLPLMQSVIQLKHKTEEKNEN